MLCSTQATVVLSDVPVIMYGVWCPPFSRRVSYLDTPTTFLMIRFLAGHSEDREEGPVRAVLLGGRHGTAAVDEATDRDNRFLSDGGSGGQEGAAHCGRVRTSVKNTCKIGA